MISVKQTFVQNGESRQSKLEYKIKSLDTKNTQEVKNEPFLMWDETKQFSTCFAFNKATDGQTGIKQKKY